MTAAPSGRPGAVAVSTLIVPAMALAAACADTGGVLEPLWLLIGLGGPIATIGLAFRRDAMTAGVLLLAVLIWPLGLLYVLTKRDRREGEDLGIGRRKPDIAAAADRKPPAPSRTTT